MTPSRGAHSEMMLLLSGCCWAGDAQAYLASPSRVVTPWSRAGSQAQPSGSVVLTPDDGTVAWSASRKARIESLTPAPTPGLVLTALGAAGVLVSRALGAHRHTVAHRRLRTARSWSARRGAISHLSATARPAVAGIKIVGTGSCAPEAVVTNDDLSEVVETSDEWIVQRTGIKCRHITSPTGSLSELALKAAQRSLEAAQISPDEVELVILATSTPDDLFGSATSVAAGLGAKNAVAFDLTAACSGFVFALTTAAQFFRTGAVKTAVVIGGDCLSRWIDWSDRSTCVLFGDGAGAVTLRATDAAHDSLIGFEMGSDGTGACHLGLKSKGSSVSVGGGKEALQGSFQPLTMNGAEVFRFATSTVAKVLTSLLEKHDVSSEDVDWLLLHQANRRIMLSAAKKLRLPEEKILCNLDEYGNTSAASIPLALDEAVRDGRVKPGQLIAMAGFGAGLSWGGVLLRL